MTEGTGSPRDPWWASGTDGLHQDEDPLDRHTAARRGETGPGEGEPRDDGHAGEWWHEAMAALSDAARVGRERAGRSRGSQGDGRDHAAGDVCHVCPVCVALRALDDSRPEVVAHLSEALRHVSLAARAFVEAQVAATGGQDDGLHRVDLDDE